MKAVAEEVHLPTTLFQCWLLSLSGFSKYSAEAMRPAQLELDVPTPIRTWESRRYCQQARQSSPAPEVCKSTKLKSWIAAGILRVPTQKSRCRKYLKLLLALSNF